MNAQAAILALSHAPLLYRAFSLSLSLFLFQINFSLLIDRDNRSNQFRAVGRFLIIHEFQFFPHFIILLRFLFEFYR